MKCHFLFRFTWGGLASQVPTPLPGFIRESVGAMVCWLPLPGRSIIVSLKSQRAPSPNELTPGRLTPAGPILPAAGTHRWQQRSHPCLQRWTLPSHLLKPPTNNKTENTELQYGPVSAPLAHGPVSTQLAHRSASTQLAHGPASTQLAHGQLAYS